MLRVPPLFTVTELAELPARVVLVDRLSSPWLMTMLPGLVVAAPTIAM